MRLQIALSTLAVAALFETTVTASAQMQPASSDGNAATDATKSNMKPGTTTGPATRVRTNKGVLPKPSFQDSRGRRHRPRKIMPFLR